MKLASLRHGRDGRLAIVSDDLRHCTEAVDIAPTLQAALDDTSISGADEPMATMVKPTIIGDMPSVRASEEAP